MSCTTMHPHAAFDRFPALVETIRQEFGSEGLMTTVERFVAAESTDLHWDSRIAERCLDASDAQDSEEGVAECVRVIGIFRNRYYIAVFLVDAARRPRRMPLLRPVERFQDAERAFLDGG